MNFDNKLIIGIQKMVDVSELKGKTVVSKSANCANCAIESGSNSTRSSDCDGDGDGDGDEDGDGVDYGYNDYTCHQLSPQQQKQPPKLNSKRMELAQRIYRQTRFSLMNHHFKKSKNDHAYAA